MREAWAAVPRWSTRCTVAVALLCGQTWAATPGDEWVQARVSGAIDLISGEQTVAAQRTTYDGFTPNDVTLEGWGWVPSLSWLGGALRVEREGLGLFDSTTRVGAGSMLNASVGPAVRLRLGSFRLEAALGYAFLQTIDASNTTSAALGGLGSHGAMIATRGNLALGPVDLEARFGFESPLVGDARASGTSPIGSLHYGGGARLGLFRSGSLDVGARVDFEARTMGLTSAAAGSVTFSRNKFGLALDVLLRPAEGARAVVKPPEGALRLLVVAAADGSPLPAAAVELERQAGAPAAAVTLGADGAQRLPGLPPGPVVVRARLDGYLPGEVRAEIVDGQTVEVKLALAREPPKVGGLVATVKDNVTKAPLPSVAVTVGETTVTTDASGVARFAGLPPGAVTIAFTAPGYKAGSEAASIVAGVESPVDLVLQPAAVKAPARISGKVRSAKGGAAVVAVVTIKETAGTANTQTNGSFSLTVPGGTYTVSITADGFIAQTKKVSVREGEEAVYNVNLVPR